MPNVILCDKVYLLIVLFAYLMHLLAVLPAFQVNTQEKGMGLPDISVGIPYLPDNIRFGYASAEKITKFRYSKLHISRMNRLPCFEAISES